MVRSIIVGNMSSLAWQEEGKDTAFIKIETSWRTMEIEKIQILFYLYIYILCSILCTRKGSYKIRNYLKQGQAWDNCCNFSILSNSSRHPQFNKKEKEKMTYLQQ